MFLVDDNFGQTRRMDLLVVWMTVLLPRVMEVE
jgi:hypothetical protein